MAPYLSRTLRTSVSLPASSERTQGNLGSVSVSRTRIPPVLSTQTVSVLGTRVCWLAGRSPSLRPLPDPPRLRGGGFGRFTPASVLRRKVLRTSGCDLSSGWARGELVLGRLQTSTSSSCNRPPFHNAGAGAGEDRLPKRPRSESLISPILSTQTVSVRDPSPALPASGEGDSADVLRLAVCGWVLRMSGCESVGSRGRSPSLRPLPDPPLRWGGGGARPTPACGLPGGGPFRATARR